MKAILSLILLAFTSTVAAGDYVFISAGHVRKFARDLKAIQGEDWHREAWWLTKSVDGLNDDENWAITRYIYRTGHEALARSQRRDAQLVEEKQVVEPKTPQPVAPKTPPAKFKTIAPVSVKAGDHIIIDASTAKGKVLFLYDEAAFPKARATREGNKLILSTSVNGAYTILIGSLADDSQEKIVVTVTGGVDPIVPTPKPPPDPPPVDPLAQIRSDMLAGFTAIAKLQGETKADLTNIKERLTALEGPRPPPIPVPPGPTPTADKLSIVVVWESADSTPAIARVLKDLDFWRSLESLGHKFYQLDKDQKDAKGNRIADVSGYVPYMDKAGLPTLILMDQATSKVLQAVRLPGTKEEVRSIVKNITGK